jgi:hypothetical protein
VITVTLTPDLEKVISECAEKRGTTPELYVLDELRAHHISESQAASHDVAPQGQTMADFFEGYAGTIDSREFVPGGAQLSRDSGAKFRELLKRKHRAGKP